MLQAGEGLRIVSATNTAGDEQIELDVIADELLVGRLSEVNDVRFIASEERRDLLRAGSGEISISLDPVDGSKAALVGVPPGTIFGLFRGVENVADMSGANLVGAGFFVYGAALELFMADEAGFRAEIFDPREHVWKNRPVPDAIPSAPVISFNASNLPKWDEWVQAYYQAQVDPQGGGKSQNLRWYASMVSDVKRLLLEGGVFAYPSRDQAGYENGHVRLVYEAIPMAYVVEAHGGGSSNGTRSILDIPVTSLHQKTPIFLGEAGKIARLEKLSGSG